MNRETLVRDLSPHIKNVIHRMPPRWQEINSIQIAAWRRLIANGSPRRATRQFVSAIEASGAWEAFLDYACPSHIASRYRDYSDGYSSDY